MMKTRLLVIAIIIGFVVISTVLFYVFFTPPVNSGYVEGIVLTLFSDFEFREYLNYHHLNDSDIVRITDDDLTSVPVLKELIDKALKQKFPVNEEGRILSDKNTLKRYHQYYATLLAEKYSKDPKDFVRILPASQSDLEISTKAYNYEFDGSFFEYQGVQYGWENNNFVDYGNDNQTDIAVYKVTHPLDPKLDTWATITGSDLEKMPLLMQAINKIGTIQESIRVETGMSNSDMSKYEKWFDDNTPLGIFEYGGKYFQESFWIA